MKLTSLFVLCLLLPAPDLGAQVRVSSGLRFEVGFPVGKGHVRVRFGKPHRGHRRHQHDARRHSSICECCKPQKPKGHYKLVEERVWVPPVYAWRCNRRGERVRYCVRRGYWKTVVRRVFVPARRGKHRHHH